MKMSLRDIKESVFVYKVLYGMGGMAITTQIRSALNRIQRLDINYKRALKNLIKMGHVKAQKVLLTGVYQWRWEVSKAVGRT